MDRLPGAPAAACAGARSRHCPSRQADAGARAHRAANRPFAPQKGKRSPKTSHGSASSPPSAGPITVPMLKPSVRTAIARACAPCASAPAWIPSSGARVLISRSEHSLQAPWRAPRKRPGAIPASAQWTSARAQIRRCQPPPAASSPPSTLRSRQVHAGPRHRAAHAGARLVAGVAALANHRLQRNRGPVENACTHTPRVSAHAHYTHAHWQAPTAPQAPNSLLHSSRCNAPLTSKVCGRGGRSKGPAGTPAAAAGQYSISHAPHS